VSLDGGAIFVLAGGAAILPFSGGAADAAEMPASNAAAARAMGRSCFHGDLPFVEVSPCVKNVARSGAVSLKLVHADD
jgi:hypothetical protein